MFVIIYQIETLLIARWSVIRTTTKNKKIKTTTTKKENQNKNKQTKIPQKTHK
jgi:hypothetical protein